MIAINYSCTFPDPRFQVLIIAAFYALVIRKPDTEEEERDDTELKSNEEWQHQNITEQDLERDPTLHQRILKPPPAHQLELDEDYVKEAREERLVESLLPMRSR